LIRALIVSADGFEDSELIEPLTRLTASGVAVDVAAPKKGAIRGKRGQEIEAQLALTDVRPETYDLLVLPGGKAPAALQHAPEALAIARHFMARKKPVAAICHGPQILAAAGLLSGRRATSYSAVRSEIEAAGASHQDKAVVVDGNLITSRRPGDIPAFMSAIFRILGLAA
jgi:protease I